MAALVAMTRLDQNDQSPRCCGDRPVPFLSVPGEAVRAVVLDDWPMIRIGVSKVLTDAAIRVVLQTGDAAAAIACVRSQAPELLVFGDHGAPSPELVEKAFAVAPDLCCIALLAHAAPDELRALLASGVHAAVPLAGDRVVSQGVLPQLFSTSAGDETAGVLTAKEREVLRLVSAGRSNAEIAAALFVSAATVKTHLGHIYDKLGARGRYEALSRAVALGLLG
jgi:DNA-binding NarL/FixJ family response regulator